MTATEVEDETIFARYARERREAEARIRAGLALGSEWIGARGTFCGVVTADHQEPGKVRLTVFDAKGPWGHRTRATLDDLVQVILDEFGYHARVEPGCVDRMGLRGQDGADVGPRAARLAPACQCPEKS